VNLNFLMPFHVKYESSRLAGLITPLLNIKTQQHQNKTI